jgi:glycerophosphoryl diester phosphodiesterase
MAVQTPPVALPRVAGHRGAAAYAPENTLGSLREAARRGAGWVEFDVKLTADGVPIVFHDDMLDRTTNGMGPVATASFERIRGLDAGAWFGVGFMGQRVPTFEEALRLVLAEGLGVNVEIKPCPGRETETARRAVTEILRLWPATRPPPLISSFKAASLAEAKARAPHLPRGLLLYEDGVPTWKRDAKAQACATVHCSQHNLTAEWAAEIRSLGYGLVAYTVNEASRARQLMDIGVQCIISDGPDRIMAGLRPDGMV